MDRRTFFGLGTAGVLAVTLDANGLRTVGAQDAPGDPGSGRSASRSDLEGTIGPLAYAIPVTAGARLLTDGFTAFSACGDAGSLLYYVRESGVGRATVYALSGWVHARLDIPAGSTIVRADVFGRRATYGTQYWKLQAVPVLDLGRTDPVIDVSTVSIAATTGVTHGVLPITTPISVQSGWAYSIVLTGTDANNQAGGFVVQYTTPRKEFVPLPPKRLYDSRGTGGAIVNGEERVVDIKHAPDATNYVPLGATAALLNLTITQTVNGGWLSVRPAGTTWDGTSSINWTTTGTTLANAVTALLGSGANERKITVRCGGATGARTHFILDGSGYYI